MFAQPKRNEKGHKNSQKVLQKVKKLETIHQILITLLKKILNKSTNELLTDSFTNNFYISQIHLNTKFLESHS